MKIIIVSTVGLIYDGITNVIISYLETMNLTGLEIYIVGTIKVEPKIREKVESIGCHVVSLPSRKDHTILYTLKLAHFIRKNHIQVMHAHGNSGTLVIEMFAAWIGGCKRRIAHSHNTRCNHIKIDKLLRPIFNLFYTDGLACGADAGKWLFNNRPFKILTNGRNIESFAFSSEVREKMRNQYGISNEIIIGHVGGFYEQKNHNFLLRIFREILKKDSRAKLFLIGDGPLKKDIELRSSDIKKNVFFIGKVDNVSDYLQAMDGMVLPSLFEGLPLVAMEWQINGLPCIFADTVTKECAITDFVEFMSLNESPERWACNIINKIRRINRQKNSEIAIKKVKEAGFDIKDSAEALRNIYLSN